MSPAMLHVMARLSIFPCNNILIAMDTEKAPHKPLWSAAWACHSTLLPLSSHKHLLLVCISWPPLMAHCNTVTKTCAINWWQPCPTHVCTGFLGFACPNVCRTNKRGQKTCCTQNMWASLLPGGFLAWVGWGVVACNQRWQTIEVLKVPTSHDCIHE